MEKMNFEKMNEVWARETGASDGAAACRSTENSAPELICRFIGDAQRMAALYSALSKKCGAAGNAVFRKLAADERRNVRHLQTAYFILTGDTCKISGSRAEVKSLLDALREAYLAESAGADAYRRSAIESSNGSITELFSMLADCESNHAAQLRKMISELMN